MSVQGLEFDKPKLVDGGHEQKSIVNTASGKQPVNAPTVEDIKRIAKGEAEESSATEWEKDLKPNLYYRKNRDAIVAEKKIETTGLQLTGDDQAIAFDSSEDAFLYEDYDQTATPLKNLTDGYRVFRHEITIEFKVGTATHYLYFTAYSSSQDAIESIDELDGNVNNVAAMYEGDDNEMALIDYIYSGSVYFFHGSEYDLVEAENVTEVSDDITQC